MNPPDFGYVQNQLYEIKIFFKLVLFNINISILKKPLSSAAFLVTLGIRY